MAGLTIFKPGDRDLGFEASGGLFQSDLEVETEIRSALRTSSARTAAAEYVAKQIAQNIFEPAEVRRSPSARSSRRANSGVTESVVARAALGVREHRVSFVDLFEFLLSLVVARIAIRVVLQRHLPVGALQLLV
jgi:hypothetical protein